MFEYLGLVLVLSNWILIGLAVRRLGITRHRSISEHIASTRSGYWLGVLGLTVIGAMFFVWIMGYVVPKLGLGQGFVWLLMGAIALQVIAGFVPDDARTWRSKVHRVAAYGEAALFVPMSVLITGSSDISRIGVIAGMVALGYFLVSLLLYFFVPKARDHYIIFQALFIVVFQVQILVSAYTT